MSLMRPANGPACRTTELLVAPPHQADPDPPVRMFKAWAPSEVLTAFRVADILDDRLLTFYP